MVINDNAKRLWIESIFVTSIFLVIIWFLFSVRYETNDDSAMMYIIAGYRSGSVEIDPIFSGVIWGGIVGGGGINYYHSFLGILFVLCL